MPSLTTPITSKPQSRCAFTLRATASHLVAAAADEHAPADGVLEDEDADESASGVDEQQVEQEEERDDTAG